MELQTSRFGHDGVQQLALGNSADRLASKAAQTIEGIARHMVPAGPARLETRSSARVLPGPPQSSQLSQRQRGLVGVARFPVLEHNREGDPFNQSYGRRFCASVVDAGQRIA
nr:hypothetical protein [Ralstonia sp. A12]